MTRYKEQVNRVYSELTDEQLTYQIKHMLTVLNKDGTIANHACSKLLRAVEEQGRRINECS